MCGRYAATLPPEMMVELFSLLNQIDYPPRYNIKPTEPIAVIREEHGRRTVQLARWGLVPRWVKDPRQISLLINARVEGIEEKPAFSEAIRRHRCIVPASGYYEWHTDSGGRKHPYYVTLADGRPMAFAGLFTTWEGPNGEEVDTAAIITVAAGPDLAAIHPRTPAILDHEAIDPWLDTDHVSGRKAVQLAQPLAPGAVRFHPVSPRVGSSVHDDPELIAPVELAPETRPVASKPKRAAGGGVQLDLF
jgi:putative SOS response-associated peptidase YedK